MSAVVQTYFCTSISRFTDSILDEKASLIRRHKVRLAITVAEGHRPVTSSTNSDCSTVDSGSIPLTT